MPRNKGGLLGNETFVLEDPEVYLERRKAKDEHLLKQLSDRERERYLYHLQFQDIMEKKSLEHRELFKKIKEKEQKFKHQEELEKQKSHKVKKRLKKIKFSENKKFLEALPKSKYYEMLQKSDKSKTFSQRDDLVWNELMTRKNSENSNERFSPMNSQTISRDGDESAESITPEERKWSSRKQSRLQCSRQEMMAIFEAQEDPETIRSGKKSTAKALSAKKIDQMFPKTTFPELRCYTLDLNTAKSNDKEANILAQLEKRVKLRMEGQKISQRMFETALSHAAITKRILAHHFDGDENGTQALNGHYNAMVDIDALAYPMEQRNIPPSMSYNVVPTGQKLKSLMWVTMPTAATTASTPQEFPLQLTNNDEMMNKWGLHALKVDDVECSSSQSRNSIKSIDKKSKVKQNKKGISSDNNELVKEIKKLSIPLTQEEFEQEATIKIPQKASSLWRNPFNNSGLVLSE